jgi:pimeloyl-ACP methyl ester carboxylesterase
VPRLNRRKLKLRRLLMLLVVAAGLSGSAWYGSSNAAADGTIAWKSCGKQFDCAKVQVPLDWALPNGRKIWLAVIRHRASKPENRIGSLFVDFGGPGVAGVAEVRSGGELLDRLGQGRFDVVGWDPRGTGESTHVRCFANKDSMAKFWGNDWTIPTTPASSVLYVPKTLAYARKCAAGSGELLDHISTADTVHDLDHLRQLVGDRQLNYRGVSYGTFIGQTYANMFPSHVRAMVLDANLDPVAFTTSVRASLKSAGADSGMVFAKFQSLCEQAGPAKCALAGQGPVVARVSAMLARLRKGPIPAPSAPPARQLPYGDALVGIWLTLGQPIDWPNLAAKLNQAANGDGSALATTVRTARINLQQALVPAVALQCADKPLPPPHAIMNWPDVIDQLTDGNMLGLVEGWWLWAPCASWQTPSSDLYAGPWNASTPNPILVIGNRYDPRTAFANSVLAARRLGNSVLLTLNGYGHTSDADLSACIDAAVARYLVTLARPPDGTICQPDHAPFDPDFGKPLPQTSSLSSEAPPEVAQSSACDSSADEGSRKAIVPVPLG